MMIVCYGLGSFMVCVDLARVPVIGQDYAREHLLWRVQDRSYPVTTWSFCVGDGMVTALENILIWLPLLFGFMRTVDFLRAVYDEDNEDVYGCFLNRLENELSCQL